MGEVTQRTLIEQALEQADELLRSAAPSAAVRELRVRHGMLWRVVRGWVHVPPHDAQIAAMLECALDLQAQVLRACAMSPSPPAVGPRMPSRPPTQRAIPVRPAQMRTTRPPPRRDASMRTTRPPARHSVPPPSRPPGSR